MRAVTQVKCTYVLAQVNLGFYDEEGNLLGEETFPQVDGNIAAAKLFHPHTEQLVNLINTCVEQAWAKLGQQAGPDAQASARDGAQRERSGT